jgi:hypothetical protein
MSLNSISTLRQTEGIVELKYLAPEWAMEPLLACARRYLGPDPNADPALGDGYSIHTLYFDTPRFDVYFREGPYRNAKYRIRRYGAEDRIYLERKSKPQGRVCKRRTSIPLWEVRQLEERSYPEGWEGRWFYRRMRTLQIGPICQISYDRVARIGKLEGQTVRFTLDRRARCASRERISVPETLADGELLSDGSGIVEIKYANSIPNVFHSLFVELGLLPSSLSKYRLGVRTLGLADKDFEECNAA